MNKFQESLEYLISRTAHGQLISDSSESLALYVNTLIETFPTAIYDPFYLLHYSRIQKHESAWNIHELQVIPELPADMLLLISHASLFSAEQLHQLFAMLHSYTGAVLFLERAVCVDTGITKYPNWVQASELPHFLAFTAHADTKTIHEFPEYYL